MNRVLVAAPTARQRAGLAGELDVLGFDVIEVSEPAAIAPELIGRPTMALVIGVGGLGETGETLAELGDRNLLPPVVLALTPPDAPTAVADALAAGASDYLPLTAAAHRVATRVQRLVGREETVRTLEPVLDVRGASQPGEAP